MTNQSALARQQELPLAVVAGKQITQLPNDLYIPPSALKVFLETFEGPLDFLLYLIRKQNLDILTIDISSITQQYVQYIELMDAMQFELAGEYLVMAAMLAEIKSRMLLPRSSAEEDEEEDPRAALIRRLQEYEQIKQAAEALDELKRMQRDTYQAEVALMTLQKTVSYPEVSMQELLLALADVYGRSKLYESHQVQKEILSTRERMAQILDRLQQHSFLPFISLFNEKEGRMGVVVSFLAVLELVKEQLIDIVQTQEFSPIHVRAKVN